MMFDIRKHFASTKSYRRLLQEWFFHADGDNTLKEYIPSIILKW